jgi:hypothetical protein
MASGIDHDEAMRLASLASQQDVDANKLAVKFEMRPTRDDAKSKAEKRPIFVDQEWVSIMVRGDKSNIVDHPVEQADRERFPKQYLAFRSNLTEIPEGMPLTEWPIVTKSMCEELKYFQVFTVEQLAALSDGNLKNVGPYAHLRQKARDYIEKAKSTTPLAEMRDELAKRDSTIEMLTRQVAELGEMTKRLQEQSTPGAVAAAQQQVLNKGQQNARR